jgi:hypothetical protein
MHVSCYVLVHVCHFRRLHDRHIDSRKPVLYICMHICMCIYICIILKYTVPYTHERQVKCRYSDKLTYINIKQVRNRSHALQLFIKVHLCVCHSENHSRMTTHIREWQHTYVNDSIHTHRNHRAHRMCHYFVFWYLYTAPHQKLSYSYWKPSPELCCLILQEQDL